MKSSGYTGRWLAVIGMNMCCAAAWAVPQAERDTPETHAGFHGPARAQERLVSDFSVFAGSDANSRSLVTGLRTGQPVTLTAPGAPGQPPTITTFDPPTRPMGNGNVFIGLSLARQELANAGITNPTPDQIKVALTGGTITTGSGATARTTSFPGVLEQRSQGQGWGQIARSQGLKLGEVVRNARHAEHQMLAARRGVMVNAAGERIGVREQHRVREREFEGRDRAEHRVERREELRERVEAGAGHRLERRIEVRERGEDIRAGAPRSDFRAGMRPGTVTPLSTHMSGRGIVTALGTPPATTGIKQQGPSAGQRGAVAPAGGGPVRSPGIVNGNGTATAVAGGPSNGHGSGAGHGRH